MHSSNESETLNKYFYISAVEILQMLNAISCTQYLLKIIISYFAVISPGVFFLSMRPLDYCFIRVDANRSLFVFDVLMLFSWRVRRINLKCAPKRRCCSRTPAGDTGSPHPGRSSARARSESLRWKFGVSTADERLWNTAVTRARERESVGLIFLPTRWFTNVSNVLRVVTISSRFWHGYYYYLRFLTGVPRHTSELHLPVMPHEYFRQNVSAETTHVIHVK